MTIMFRIATAADDAASPRAEIGVAQAAAFRALLVEARPRLGPLIDPDDLVDAPADARFEARVCPLALAAMARVLDFDERAITVLEKAQFRARRVVVRRGRGGARMVMEVALTSDEGVELDLASGNAYALLESLGLAPDSVGELPVDEVRQRLGSPAVRRRMGEQNVAHYSDRLERLLASAPADESSRFEWA